MFSVILRVKHIVMKKERITVIILIGLLFIISNPVHSQLECKVLVAAISGEYDGGCKKGLAHGNGIAEGVDRYEGRFVKGYPHGKGRYEWSTGEYYEGEWKKGLRYGKGSYYFPSNKQDTVLAGIWKADKYIGPDYERPKVIQKYNVQRVDFIRSGDGRRVEFWVYQGGNQTSELYNFTIVGSSGTEFKIGQSFGFDNVVFPFTCKINYNIWNLFRSDQHSCIVEIKISEPAFWQVKIRSL